MVNKKYAVLVALLLIFQVASFAQTSSWDWKDSSVVPTSSTTHFTEFLQNKNPFPAKPRNAWELSAGGGYLGITGDGKASQGFTGTLSLRKALNNIFSYRLIYAGAITTAPGGTIYNYSNVPASAPISSYVSQASKTLTHNFAIDFIASVNTFSNYRGDPTSNLYVFGGVGIGVSALEFKGTDGKYHFNYPPTRYTLATMDHQRIFTTTDLGAGYAYKLNKKWNIGIEERVIIPVNRINFATGYDGQSGTKNIYYSTLLKLNYNL